MLIKNPVAKTGLYYIDFRRVIGLESLEGLASLGHHSKLNLLNFLNHLNYELLFSNSLRMIFNAAPALNHSICCSL